MVIIVTLILTVGIQIQLLFLLIPTIVDGEDYSKYSNTTLVSINRKKHRLSDKKSRNSNTTLVSINHL